MVTIKDIAREANLSVGTVSRVLNNRGYISQETRNKVYHVMQALNYQPNEVARSLTKKRTNILGLLMPSIVHPYFSQMISRLEKAAAKYGYKVLLCNTHEKVDMEKDYIDMCISNRVAGIIICSSQIEDQKLAELDIPIVVIEKRRLGGIYSVDCDNYRGGTLATELLIRQGCKNLLHFGQISNVSMPADDRSQAFSDVAGKHGVAFKVLQSTQDEFNRLCYYEFIRKAFRDHPDVDGIFASSDLLAMQTLQICAELGKRVPEDVKVVGFDDTLIATLAAPQITTVHQPIKEMAEAAVQIVDQLNHGIMAPLHITLPVSLIERGSC